MNLSEPLPSRALRVTQPASRIDALELQLAASPQPSAPAGHAVVRVRSAAVNPSDVKAALGAMPHAVWPRTPGRDYAGVVAEGPTEWLGREVWGSGGDLGITRDGSHAAWLVVPASALRAKPAPLSLDEAGAIGVPFVTAYEGFRRSGLPAAGQTVLVLGANGRVGQAAIQLAAMRGARVIGVQRRPGPLPGWAPPGVEIVDASAGPLGPRLLEITEGRGADIVYNTVGSAYFEDANAAMAKGATQIFIATHERAVPFDIFRFYRGRHSYVGVDSLALDCAAAGALLEQMAPAFEAGGLRPFAVAPASLRPLDTATDAYRSVLAGCAERIVLRP